MKGNLMQKSEKLDGGKYENFGYRRTDELTDGSGFIRSQGES